MMKTKTIVLLLLVVLVAAAVVHGKVAGCWCYSSQYPATNFPGPPLCPQLDILVANIPAISMEGFASIVAFADTPTSILGALDMVKFAASPPIMDSDEVLGAG